MTSDGGEPPALVAARSKVARNPKDAQALNELGMVLGDLGRFSEAASALRQALAIQPRFPQALHNLGMALMELGDTEAAAQSFRETLALAPRIALVHADLGEALLRLGRHVEAEASYRRAATLEPASAAAHFGIANALRRQARFADAELEYRRALKLDDKHVDAYCMLAVALAELGRFGEAQQSLEAALHVDPRSYLAHANCAQLFMATGRLDEAEAMFRRALELRPNAPENFSNLLYMLNFAPGRGLAVLGAEHAEFGRRFLQPLLRNHPNAPDPERPLRIGYVSGDFRRHSVAFFLEPVLASHDRTRYEVTCYHTYAISDATTQRLRGLAGRWRDVFALNDEALAALVREDAIDILVDLAGHTGGNRLLAFARKPAPVQATWLGYPTATGLPSIDFRITDARVDDLDVAPGESERPARLATSYFCYTGPGEEAATAPPPALASSRITFGSFNNLTKVSARTMALWSRVLQAVPRSRLLVKSKPLADAQVRAEVEQRFAASGVPAARLALHAQQAGLAEHLAAYREVDIGLDTFPYNGATTTCEALWMGVPVVSLRGATHASRMGDSILSAAGLADFVCRGEDEFVAKCVAVAADLPALASLRDGLRPRLLASPLADAVRSTRDLENAYRGMWRSWCMRK